ncbi:MAG TPA: dTDP-4-dehydrorhamnose reductase [Chthonomonadales bacterium]|nr:dTDP-4-dehydrorhamnose reductase [Chthonomonadales bacterium]
MRVLVTGARGMLGSDLCAELRLAGHEPIESDVVAAPLRLDVTDLQAVRAAMSETAPEVVIHCAAYTQVDRAEQEPDAAYRLNALGSWCVASACAEAGVPVCAISTDFVFDGRAGEPYDEYAVPAPVSVYGASKLAGEECVRRACARHWIVRTSWLFGVHGLCFPATILRAAEQGRPLRVVADQAGTPTHTVDLARALIRIVARPLWGTYHVANRGIASWYDLAVEAVSLAGMGHIAIDPITTGDWPTPARRPAFSPLATRALDMLGDPAPRHWREALADYIARRATETSR